MNKLLKGSVSLLAFPFLKLYKQTLVRLFKNEALSYYLKTIQATRMLFMGIVSFFVCLGFLVSGFIMLHVGGFMYLSVYKQKPELALLLFTILGFVYFFLSALILVAACSEKKWLKYSKYNDYNKK